jgi:hypothetical protein
MKIFVSLILLIKILFVNPINIFGFELLPGDILFQDGSDNDFSNAIKEVTNSIEGYNFSHCGIYYVDSNRKAFVIEAFNDGVVLTDISEFMNRYLTKDNKPKIAVGRLVDSLKTFIPSAILSALKYLGKKYDSEFDLTNDEIYCSELIYFAYKDLSDKNIFKTNQMTFIDINTNQIHPHWQKHFDLLGIPVPEGEEGINPGAISKSNKIKIVHYYF